MSNASNLRRGNLRPKVSTRNAVASRQPVPGLRKRRYKMRLKMRAFLTQYSKCLSIADAADRINISERLVYVWQRRSPWFAERLKRAERTAIDRVRGAAFHKALVDKDTTAIFNILKARDPMFMPAPKQVQHTHTETTVKASFSSTTVSAAQLTDAELEEMDRLLKKMGVPEHLLKAQQKEPVALEGETVGAPQPKRD